MELSSQRVGKLTYDDFLQFPDDGQRHDLIDGAHYVTPSPFTRHQRLVFRLLEAFAFYLRDHPVGETRSRCIAAPPMDGSPLSTA